MATAGEFASAIDAALDEGAHQLWVDLSAAEFLDSSGVDTLLSARRRADRLNRHLSVICPEGSLSRALKLAASEQPLTIHPNLDAAHRAD